ncbi:MAG TPA: methyltransferase domain-containing protein [Urbifossiella sp.]|jgi:tocopherol O-methyltransferase|nr:methyltransferase domain-containing protein [Urbifossiella sp.]
MIRSSRPIPPAAVADHYEDLDRIYREVWGEHVHHGYWRTGRETPTEAVEQLVELVAAGAGIRPGCAAVDIGCGYGATARYLAARHGAAVTGLTITPAQYKYAVAATPGDNPRYLLRDWLANDLPATAFDAAYAIESTEHMEDKARVFAEAFRVLRPGGRLVVCAWTAAAPAKAWEKRHLLEPICREGRLPGMGTEADYRALLTGAGFEAAAATDISRQVRGTWGICVRRAVVKIARDAEARAYLLSAASRNRVFLLTVGRIWLAYRTGSMRYLVWQARKPG